MRYGVFFNQRGGWSIVFEDGKILGNFDSPERAKSVANTNGFVFSEDISNEKLKTKNEERAQRKVYISGPMSGLPNYNFEAFDRAAEAINARGDIAVNPANRGREWVAKNGDRNMSESEYSLLLNACLRDILDCQCVYMLRGWEKSRGAKRELSMALLNNLQIETQ